ncbi:MAG: hypothetical protein BWZ10_01603 [candidate division BRC1 bacterium ADurb.BinA364]|nr:MAG: hypothetical protein BWZ10_01603 [candidate division BRC1 bacterium ADurb.BinA364]
MNSRIRIRSKRRARAAGLLAAACLACWAGACKKSAAPEDESGSAAAPPSALAPMPDGKIRIALIPRFSSMPIYQFARESARRAADRANVELLWMEPGDASPDAQAAAMEAAIEEQAHGIAINCADPAALRAAIDRADGAGVAVATWECDSPDSQRRFFYGINGYQCGVALARELANLLGGAGKIAVLSTTNDDPAMALPIAGIGKELRRFPNLELAKTVFCEGDPAKALALLDQTAREIPELKGWIFLGPWVWLASPDPASIDASWAIVGVDAFEACWPYLESGAAKALLARPYFEWGAETVRMLADSIRGAAGAPRGFQDSGFEWVTAKSLPAYRAQFINMRLGVATPAP